MTELEEIANNCSDKVAQFHYRYAEEYGKKNEPQTFSVKQTEGNNYYKTEKDHSDQHTNPEAQSEYRADEKSRHGERHNDHLSDRHAVLPRKISMPMKNPARAAKRRSTINTVATAQLQFLE